MENPLRNIELKEWPDFLIAVSGFVLVISMIGLFSSAPFSAPSTLLFGGAFLFGLGAKLSHYRYRDSNIKGNSNAWFSGWRHRPLADTLAAIGMLLVALGAYAIYLEAREMM